MSTSSVQHTSSPDAALLREFADKGRETAFAEVVARNVVFVRSVGVRVLGNENEADDVTVQVFAFLARKAAVVSRHGNLMGWLHRTAVFVASRNRRGRERHRAKLANFAIMNEPGLETPPELHHVDECLLELRESEQEVLRLRYWEGLSNVEISKRIGKSLEATKKQTSRALEAMEQRLLRRGLTRSSVFAAGPLSSPSGGLAAPALVNAALKQAAALKWRVIFTHTLAVMNTVHCAATAAILLLLLACIPVVSQEMAIAKLKSQIKTTASDPIKPTKPSTSSNSEPASVVMNIEQVAKDLAMRDGGLYGGERDAARARLNSLDAEAIAALLEDISKLTGGFERQQLVLRELFSLMQLNFPRQALEYASVLFSREGSRMDKLHVNCAKGLMTLLREDPEAAIGYYLKWRDAGWLEAKGTNANELAQYAAFVGHYIAIHPERRDELFQPLDGLAKVNALNNSIVANLPDKVWNWVLEESAKLTPGHYIHVYPILLDKSLATGNLADTGALYQRIGLKGEDEIYVSSLFVKQANKFQNQRPVSVTERLDWLKQNLSPPQFARSAGIFLSDLEELKTEKTWGDDKRMEALRNYDWGDMRDVAITTLFKRKVPPDDAAAAFGLAMEINNNSLRMESLQRLWRRFEPNPSVFLNAVSQSTLTAEEQAEVYRKTIP